jgi:signal transduction histidine kinase
LGLPLETTLRKSLCNKSDCAPLDWLLDTRIGSRLAEEVTLGSRHLRIVSDPIPGGGSVVILRDITQQREMEEQVRRGQSLEAVGQLSAGVAHELNNLLAVVIGNLSLITGLTHDPADREALEKAQRSVLRVAELTQQLQGFARQTLLWLQPVQPQRVVEEALQELRNELPAQVNLCWELAPALPMIQADPKLLKLVLLQLCRRAVGNLTRGGEIRVSLGTAHFPQRVDESHPEVRPGSYILLRVADSGPALSPEAVQRIFEPFHSPNNPVGGLALGMVHGIVKQHLGWIECTSIPHQGTRFDLYFPALTETLPSSRPIPTKVAPRPGPRRILLADDNETLLNLASRFLRQDGYEVMTATDGQDALEVFQREAERIDLVILDQVMPECSGSDALQQMRQRSPRLRALIATDASDSVRLRNSEIDGIVCKPYRERELLQAVRDALSGTS